MSKEFIPYDKIRNDALKLAHKIYHDGFEPDVLYTSLRGGAYMANVISEYFKIVRKDKHPVLYAAVVARSYNNVHSRSSNVLIDGWTYPPSRLRPGDKILFVDDIFDSGDTLNFLVKCILEKGIPREDIKVVVHDFKYCTYKEKQPDIFPDYYSRKIIVDKPENSNWFHYLSHELIGLTNEELEANYYSQDSELRDVLGPILGNN